LLEVVSGSAGQDRTNLWRRKIACVDCEFCNLGSDPEKALERISKWPSHSMRRKRAMTQAMKPRNTAGRKPPLPPTLATIAKGKSLSNEKSQTRASDERMHRPRQYCLRNIEIGEQLPLKNARRSNPTKPSWFKGRATLSRSTRSKWNDKYSRTRRFTRIP
jgi:hypothetical protein